MLTKIDSFFKKVGKRTFEAMHSVHRAKEHDLVEKQQEDFDLAAQEKLAELKVSNIAFLTFGRLVGRQLVVGFVIKSLRKVWKNRLCYIFGGAD